MFFNENILQKKGQLAKVWLAAHFERKLSKAQFLQANIQASVNSILGTGQAPMALRLTGQLLLGVVRIFARKTRYLLEDCNEALLKLKLAFRPGAVDLAPDQTTANMNAITLHDTLTEFDILLPDPVLNISRLYENVGDANASQSHIAPTQSQNVSRAQDITMYDASLSLSGAGGFLGEDDALDILGGQDHTIGLDADVLANQGADDVWRLDLGIDLGPQGEEVVTRAQRGRRRRQEAAAGNQSALDDDPFAIPDEQPRSPTAVQNAKEATPNQTVEIDGMQPADVDPSMSVGNASFGLGDMSTENQPVKDVAPHDPMNMEFDFAPDSERAADASVNADLPDLVAPGTPSAQDITIEASPLAVRQRQRARKLKGLAVDDEIELSSRAIMMQLTDASDLMQDEQFVPGTRRMVYLQRVYQQGSQYLQNCLTRPGIPDHFADLFRLGARPRDPFLPAYDFDERRAGSEEDQVAPQRKRSRDFMEDIGEEDSGRRKRPSLHSAGDVSAVGMNSVSFGAGDFGDMGRPSYDPFEPQIDENFGAGEQRNMSAVPDDEAMEERQGKRTGGSEEGVEEEEEHSSKRARKGKQARREAESEHNLNVEEEEDAARRQGDIFDFEETEEQGESLAVGAGKGFSRTTVRAIQLLRSKLISDDEDSGTGSRRTREVTFKELAPKAGRSDAARLFFEVLLLKTKDFIDVKQVGPFGDITVGAKEGLLNSSSSTI
ncbi:Rec8 like protein-domain-containing protein [Cladochytrium replicatum]|nr:Rec8 like protein-domain-containing protein [Cladochytrium replicatum]